MQRIFSYLLVAFIGIGVLTGCSEDGGLQPASSADAAPAGTGFDGADGFAGAKAPETGMQAALPLPTETAEALPTEPPTSTPDPLATAGAPIRLEIPAIGVDALVEQVGLTADQAMDVPKGWMNVGWYSPGFKPSSVGNAVIAGHLDTSAGGPAVFWRLHDLVPGDEVTVAYENGDRYTFVVKDQQMYDYDAAGPVIDTIFGPSQVPGLNLITCRGAWDYGKATYTKRLVVATELMPEKTVRLGEYTQVPPP